MNLPTKLLSARFAVHDWLHLHLPQSAPSLIKRLLHNIARVLHA